MYEHFTDRARKVMQLASHEAQRLKHYYIGTEHILLGLIREGGGVAGNVLKNLTLDPDRVRREIEKVILCGPAAIGLEDPPQTSRAKKVIEYAIAVARTLKHNYVGTEHILLGLLREEEGVASQVLRNLGLTLSAVRDEVLAVLGSAPTRIVGKPAVPAAQGAAPPESLELPPRIALAVGALDEAVHLLRQMKEEAVARQEFEWGAALRDREHALRQVKEWLIRNKDIDRHGHSN
jgi:ATP-dependent Clp protease ATP-binding subunit ClpA